MIPDRLTTSPAALVAAALAVAAGCGVERHEVAPDAPDAAAGIDVLEDIWTDGLVLPDGFLFPDAGCGDGETACFGRCVDLLSNGDHCGVCGRTCGDRGDCGGGQCVCDSGHVYCPGGCVRLDSDPENCGLCGVVCDEGLDCRRGACD